MIAVVLVVGMFLVLVVAGWLLEAMSTAMTYPVRHTPSWSPPPTEEPVVGEITIEGLPGRRAPWSGSATCSSPDGFIVVDAMVPAAATDWREVFELQVATGAPDGLFWYVGPNSRWRSIEPTHYASAAGGTSGEMVVELHTGPTGSTTTPSSLRLAWDCGRAP